MVAGDQGGEELVREQVVRDCVDVEGEADVLLGRVEDGLAARDAGVEDKDGWVADGFADLSSDGGEGGGGGDVTFEVVDVGGCGECQSRRVGIAKSIKRDETAESGNLRVSKVIGITSSTTTLIPFFASIRTTCPPIPPAPPVTSTTSWDHT